MPWRLLHVDGLTVVAAAVVAVAALTASSLLGPKPAWAFPHGWAIIPATLGGADPDLTGILRLSAQPDLALVPFLVAIGVWVPGTALAVTSTRPARRLRTS